MPRIPNSTNSPDSGRRLLGTMIHPKRGKQWRRSSRRWKDTSINNTGPVHSNNGPAGCHSTEGRCVQNNVGIERQVERVNPWAQYRSRSWSTVIYLTHLWILVSVGYTCYIMVHLLNHEYNTLNVYKAVWYVIASNPFFFK